MKTQIKTFGDNQHFRMFLFSVFPEMTQIRGGAAHFLGAKPTQSMAFPVCLHRSRRFRRGHRPGRELLLPRLSLCPGALPEFLSPLSGFFAALPFCGFGLHHRETEEARGSLLRA